MRIQEILRRKGAEVLTIGPDTSVSQAVAFLSEHRIGAVVVIGEGPEPQGILSERDVVREIGRAGPPVLERPASALMTRALQYCSPDEALDTVLARMTEGRFRHMPVVSQGRMVGLVSIGDVVKARLSELSMERDALEGMVTGR